MPTAGRRIPEHPAATPLAYPKERVPTRQIGWWQEGQEIRDPERSHSA
jgi:hypothetical protein